MADRSQTVLIVAAHPDDELLGCGGAIARHAREGAKVYVLFMTDGVGARGATGGEAARRKSAEAALKILGAEAPMFLDFPDNAMDGVPLLDIVKKIEEAVARVKPSIVYTHHGGDLNVDHQVTHRAIMTACRPLPGSSVRAIYGFEVLSSTEWSLAPFHPARFVGIDIELKLKALREYHQEMREAPHARSYEAVRALAVVRGASAGLPAAEGFSVLRLVEV
jgi:LmbE family N-acetylglucosaminyl deacetylase